MKSIFAFCFLFLAAVAPVSAQDGGVKSMHDFTMKNIDGGDVPLSTYAGKVVLVVNTASKCGYTPQYASLQELHQRFADRGLRILAFPANNFGAQEPGSNEQIKEFCSANYEVTFDLFSKISVKGEDRHPLYTWLTQQSPFPGDIRWNFTKFLVDGQGKVVARFETKTDPLDESVVAKIEGLLNE